MATQIDLLKAKIARIERELDEAKSRLKSIERSSNGGEQDVPPFVKLRGILKGKAHFTEEEIQALKIRSRDID